MQSVATPLIQDWNSCNYTCRRGEQSMTSETVELKPLLSKTTVKWTFLLVQNNGKVNILATDSLILLGLWNNVLVLEIPLQFCSLARLEFWKQELRSGILENILSFISKKLKIWIVPFPVLSRHPNRFHIFSSGTHI
jgi:hypothetical protein